MSTPESLGPRPASRRGFLSAAAGGGLGLAALATGCATPTASAGERKQLRAAFSTGGLQSTWCKLGKETAELWGKLLGVEIVWYDGEFDAQKQRAKLDLIVDDDWDFCCFQAMQTDTLEEPVRQLKKRNIPVISMDTMLVDKDRLREVGVWCEVRPDQVFMGRSSTRYMLEKIGGRGKVIHIGGLSAHSGAQGRKQGFEEALKDFPDVKVMGDGVRWCDYETEKARNAFESFLNSTNEPIAGAFFHNDDMAVACIPALEGTPHAKMIITGVDGQKEGLTAIREGKLAATTVNPVCLIHMTALAIGQFVVRNKEPVDSLPLEIVTPGPLVSQDTGNLDAMFFLADPRHCLV